MFTITTRGLDEAIERLNRSPAGLERGVRSAIRRTLRGAKSTASQLVHARYVKNAGAFVKTLRLKQSGFSGSMTSTGSRTPLKKFIVRPSSRPRKMPPGGVHATVVRGQGGQILHAFLQRSGSVVERVGRSRFPIRQLKSVSPPGAFGNPRVGPKIEANIYERLGVNLNHELAYFLG